MEQKNPNLNNRKLSAVFIFSIIITAVFVILGAIFPNQFNKVGSSITSWITEYFGWYYMIIVAVMIFFCIFLIFSRLEN